MMFPARRLHQNWAMAEVKMTSEHRELKESSGIIKPPGKPGKRSSITWTADIDETIVSMKEGGSSFEKIASKLGNGLKKNDIQNRWNRHLTSFVS